MHINVQAIGLLHVKNKEMNTWQMDLTYAITNPMNGAQMSWD